jgi:hypothetical protein
MQPPLHAAARVVGPEVLQGKFADVLDAVLDDPVALDIRAGLDELAQFLLQLRRQQRRPTGPLPIPQTIDALGIVAHHPITQRRPIHAGMAGRRLPADAVQGHCKSQKTPQNPGIVLLASQSPKLGGAQLSADRKRYHGGRSR